MQIMMVKVKSSGKINIMKIGNLKVAHVIFILFLKNVSAWKENEEVKLNMIYTRYFPNIADEE